MFRKLSFVGLLALTSVGRLSLAAAGESKHVVNEAKSSPKVLAVSLGKGVTLQMVLIPAGEFTMGSPDSDHSADKDEKPQHRVRITKPFYLGKYLVTQAQWEAVMGNDPSLIGGPKMPVENVSWQDCQRFLEKLNAKDGTGYGRFALPTESQWEYACRAGSTARYCFGDDESRLGEYAWYGDNSGNTVHPVGEKKPNAWGLYDMHGNIWEWCEDWYDGRYYTKAPMDDPPGPAIGSNHVFRGGCWGDAAGSCRSSNRYSYGPESRGSYLGFRVSLVPSER
jgi:formylglycine-generating enzyme required for sulfatase activity